VSSITNSVNENTISFPSPRGLLYYRYTEEKSLADRSFEHAEQRENEIGIANRENVQRMLSSLAVHPFTERLGYICQSQNHFCVLIRNNRIPIADVHLLVAQARLEADNPALKV